MCRRECTAFRKVGAGAEGRQEKRQGQGLRGHIRRSYGSTWWTSHLWCDTILFKYGVVKQETVIQGSGTQVFDGEQDAGENSISICLSLSTSQSSQLYCGCLSKSTNGRACCFWKGKDRVRCVVGRRFWLGLSVRRSSPYDIQLRDIYFGLAQGRNDWLVRCLSNPVSPCPILRLLSPHQLSWNREDSVLGN